MLFSYHLLYFCTALSLIIMLSSHYHHHKSKTFSQLTQCPFTGTLLLFKDIVITYSDQIERHVNLGRLHMRPIQWHLKNSWRVPESLEKVIQVPRSLHPHLQWWLKEDNALTGQPLHPIKHALQIFTDASIEGWGAHLDEHLAGATWSPPGSKLYI